MNWVQVSTSGNSKFSASYIQDRTKWPFLVHSSHQHMNDRTTLCRNRSQLRNVPIDRTDIHYTQMCTSSSLDALFHHIVTIFIKKDLMMPMLTGEMVTYIGMWDNGLTFRKNRVFSPFIASSVSCLSVRIASSRTGSK